MTAVCRRGRLESTRRYSTRRVKGQYSSAGRILKPSAPICRRCTEELGGGQVRQIREELHLLVGEIAGPMVDHAQGPDAGAVRQHQGGARVETDPGLPDHRGVVCEPIVTEGIRHDERRFAYDGVGAKRDVPRRLPRVQAKAGLEPLSVAIHPADKRDRHGESGRRESRDAIEPSFRLGIQDLQPTQRSQASLLVSRDAGRLPPGCRAQHPGADLCARIAEAEGPDEPIGHAGLGSGLGVVRSCHEDDRHTGRISRLGPCRHFRTRRVPNRAADGDPVDGWGACSSTISEGCAGRSCHSSAANSPAGGTATPRIPSS